jgi:UDP-glucose 4-epimerase
MIFHLAARVDVTSSFEDPKADLMTNYLGTMNVLDHSLKHDVKKVVFSSSAAVYGDTTELPVTEGSLKEPLSPYGLHKLMSENLMEIYRKQWGLSTVSLRFFNVYGPRQDPSNPYSGVISKFISSSIANEPIIIFGDGEQTRDFIYVGDIAQALYLAASSRVFGSFNAGTGKETSINELAGNTKKASNSVSQIVHMPPRKGEILRSCAEISSLKDALDFEPETGLHEGLRRTIDHIRREG